MTVSELIKVLNTLERAERCWVEFWMGDGEVKNER